jgi:2,3-bisphosphoglycerate-dependent phosphoglycerate mutase
MTDLLLIRHGQSANNAQDECLRVPDPGLTEIGVRQAEALASWLQDHAVTHLYCSPFLRSLETMRPLANARPLPVRVRSDLFELGGCYSGYEPGRERGEPGLGRSHLMQAYPTWDIDELIQDAGWWGREYETLHQGRLRAAAVVQWLAAEVGQTQGLHVLIIHADFKRLLLAAMFGASTWIEQGVDLEQARLFNTGVTHCRFTAEGWELLQFNATSHLAQHLVT